MPLRSHIIQEKFLDPLRLYVAFLVTLFVCMLLIRGIEILAIADIHSISKEQFNMSFSGILNDFLFTLKLGALLYPVFWFLFVLMKPISEIYCRLLLFLFAIIYLSIDKYFFVSLTPLGADFWGYSYDDIATTIRSSSEFSLLDVFAFILVPIVSIVLYNRLKKIYVPHPIYPLIIGSLLVGSFFLSDVVLKSGNSYKNETDFFLTENKAKLFMDKSLEYFAEERSNALAVVDSSIEKYPFLHPFEVEDVLGPYFSIDSIKPNLVFIQVEGLGRAFTGPDADNGGFTPYLDSLAAKSLYWENCIAPAGRTFGILPNMYGSLPFGSNGFNEMGENMPDHITLISQLNAQGYKSHYFYGGDVSFDNQDLFLEKQGIDYILSEQKFPNKYTKMKANSGGFSWGYSDKDVFDQSLNYLNTTDNSPRMDMYMTLVTHEPFKVPDNTYEAKFDKRVKQFSQDKQKKFETYRGIYECLLYTDDAIKEFIAAYSKRPEFKNTIFIITGDHRMIPIPHRNRIDRFHVPLLIWSPMLKKTASFKSLVSHSQLTPTFMAFFKENYGLKFPKEVAFITGGMQAKKAFGSTLHQPIMRNKGDLSVYIDNEYFLDNGGLYKILPGMELEQISLRSKSKEIEEKLAKFKLYNNYATTNNALYENVEFEDNVREYYAFDANQKSLLTQINSDSINSDSLIALAQGFMKADKYDTAITVLKYTLNRSPNYADARILLGRIYYWQDKLELSEKELSIAVVRSPQYKDGYRALTDCLEERENYLRLYTVIDSALSIEPNYEYYAYLKALSLYKINLNDSTQNIIDSIKVRYPNNKKLNAINADL